VAREPTPTPQEEGDNAMQSREDRRSTGLATNDEQDTAEETGVARRRQIRPRKYSTWDSIPPEKNKQEDEQPLLRRRYAESSGDEWEVSQDTSFRMNAEISETVRARLLRFGMQIPELLTQRKFVSAMCHAHSNAHKPPKTVAPTVLMLE